MPSPTQNVALVSATTVEQLQAQIAALQTVLP
jgi:hypothetical protein